MNEQKKNKKNENRTKQVWWNVRREVEHPNKQENKAMSKTKM